MSFTAISSAQVREIAYDSPIGPGSRRAIIAPQDVIYGLVRMFITERETPGGKEQIEVFRSPEDAEIWLGAPKKSGAQV